MKRFIPSVKLKEQNAEDYNFMEDSMSPKMPPKYQDLCLWGNQDHFITPWNIHLERKIQHRTPDPSRLSQNNRKTLNTIPVRSRIQSRKKKNPEETHEQFKMRNTFVQFRIKTGRKKHNQSADTHLDRGHNSIQHSFSKNDFFNTSKTISTNQKSPKLKFLQRRFKLKNMGGNFVRKNEGLWKERTLRQKQTIENNFNQLKDSPDKVLTSNSQFHPSTIYRSFREAITVQVRRKYNNS